MSGGPGIRLAEARPPDGMRLYAIGDVHGCRALLAEMHARIEAELARDRPDDWRIVHIGDYGDRGPDTAGVLDFLVARMQADARVLCLRGNHDEGFLNFVAGTGPDRIFTANGGEATAASYGVAADFSSAAGVAKARAGLAAALPESHRAFLSALPFYATFGDFFLCHAGIRPGVPLDAQDPQDLIWIRDAFLDDPRLHPKVIVHGHTPAAEPEIMPNRVNVDTRAFASGRLSALMVEGSRKSLLEVSGPSR